MRNQLGRRQLPCALTPTWQSTLQLQAPGDCNLACSAASISNCVSYSLKSSTGSEVASSNSGNLASTCSANRDAVTSIVCSACASGAALVGGVLMQAYGPHPLHELCAIQALHGQITWMQPVVTTPYSQGSSMPPTTSLAQDAEKKTCKSCGEGCAACNNAGSCTTCKAGMYNVSAVNMCMPYFL